MNPQESSTGRTAHPYIIIGILWSLVFVSGSQTLVITPILPQIAEEITVSEGVLGILITGYATAVGTFALISGPISDRIGRRRILLLGTSLMTGALFLHLFASEFASLFAVRVLAGIAGGLIDGAAVAYVADYFPRERRGWANGWVLSGISAGLIAGVPIGSILAEQLGFRWVFGVFGVLLTVVLVLLWAYVPQPDVARSAQLSFRSAIDGYADLLRRPTCLAAVAIFVLIFAGNSLYVTYLPIWLATTLGIGTALIGMMFFFGGLGTVVGGPPAGKASDWVGRKPIILASSFGIAFAMAITTLVVGSAVTAFGLFFVLMGMMAARAAPFQTVLSEMVSSDQRGSFLNLTVGVGQFGSGIGGGVAGALYMTVGFDTVTLLSSALMILIGLLIWRFLPETLHQTVEP